MAGTALESCESCGRMRWAADRFCAECGQPFGDQPHTSALHEFDADALVPETPLDDNDATAQSRFPRPFVVAAGSLVLVLALLGLFGPSRADDTDADLAASSGATVDLAPMSGFGGSPTVTPVAQLTEPVDDLRSESGLPVTPVPPPPDPDATPLPTPTTDPTRPMGNSSTPEAARSTLLDRVIDADLDLGATWIATLTDDHRPRAVNIGTGEEIVLERTNQFGAPVFFERDGAYSVGISGEGDSRSSWFSIQPWSGAETTATRLVRGDFVGSYRDPEHGTIVVSAAADGASAGQALDLDDNRSVRFDVLPGSALDTDWARWTHASFGGIDHITTSSGGAVWIWTLDGWAKWGDGEAVVVGRDEVVLRTCSDTIDSCPVSVKWAAHSEALGAVPVSANWRIATFTNSTSARPERMALSGDLLLSGESAGGATMISVWDFAPMTTFEVGLDVDDVFWMEFSPNGRYLFVSSSTGTSVIDAESGDLVLVSERASGPINGLAPTPLVFLDSLDR